MASPIKVFCWSDGLHAPATAADARLKALGAWGSDQNLFATGLAREIDQEPEMALGVINDGVRGLRQQRASAEPHDQREKTIARLRRARGR